MIHAAKARPVAAEWQSHLPLVPGLHAVQAHPKTGRYGLVTQKNTVGTTNTGSQRRCVASGPGDVITFLPFSLSRGTSPVRMAPGSPFSPYNTESF